MLQQWGGQGFRNRGIPLSWTIYAGIQWGPEVQGHLRFLGKWQSGQITFKTNKPRVLMMSLSLDWMFSLFPLYMAKGGQMAWAMVCFHYCPCRFHLQSVDTALFFFFKHIKTAPDTSIPTRGIEKHLACRLPGLPPWMSVSDEGEKNDTLYGHCKKPFIQLQRVCSSDPWWQEQNQYLSSPCCPNTTQRNYWSNACWAGRHSWSSYMDRHQLHWFCSWFFLPDWITAACQK